MAFRWRADAGGSIKERKKKERFKGYLDPLIKKVGPPLKKLSGSAYVNVDILRINMIEHSIVESGYTKTSGSSAPSQLGVKLHLLFYSKA